MGWLKYFGQNCNFKQQTLCTVSGIILQEIRSIPPPPVSLFVLHQMHQHLLHPLGHQLSLFLLLLPRHLAKECQQDKFYFREMVTETI